MNLRPRPRLVIFDLDGLLAGEQRQQRIEILAGVVGLAPARIAAALSANGLRARSERGELGLEDYLDALRRRHGLDIPAEAFIDAHRQSLRLHHEVLALAQALAAQTTLALFANGEAWLGRHLPKFLPELRPLFGTRMLVSAQLGLAKPDPQAFYACLATLGFSAASALMIDDDAENTVGARSAGLDAIHYVSPSQLAAELRLRGFDLEPVHAP